MIVKFHARGKGGGSGPVDYLLGRERNRERATVLQGNPEEVRELIDATPFAKKYTSGVLSFAEKELPPGGREKVMASFERVLMPGLEKNQYSILWVEHQDKGRLELNFVIPNMELQSGKRLQPYYDRADRPRIDAWQTLVNHHYGLHDPNAPENRRILTLPDNLPETKQALAESVTRGIDALYHVGEIKGRQDVIQALTEAGIEVVRVTRSSISIADPNGGKNIRLKGAFYEQSFTDGRGVREKAERESRIYRENAERRVQEARRICKQGTDLKRIFNQERYQRPYNSPERTAGEISENDRQHDGYTLANRTENERETLAVADYRLSADVCHDRESAVVSGHEDKRKHEYSPRAERESGEAEREDMGRALSRGQQRAFSGVAEGDETRIVSILSRFIGIITPMNRNPPYTEASVTKQEKTALNMARFIRGQTLTLLEKLNELDADEQADICESLHDHADELYRSCLARFGDDGENL